MISRATTEFAFEELRDTERGQLPMRAGHLPDAASWVQLAAGSNLLMAESLMRKAMELLKEVAGASPSPLEQLLAERVVACWLQVGFYDSLIAQTREYTPAKMRMLQQQHDAAQRRYLAAMKTLATIRKLVTPPRSPIEIASKLAGERAGLRLREAPVAAGERRR